MKKFKKLMSVSTLCLVGVLGIGLLTGCNDEEDEKVDECTENCIVEGDDDDGTTGPASGLVFNNLFSMLNGFTFEGSIDIAYGDIEVGLEFNNGQAVIPLDTSDFSFDISKLAVGGDLTIVYDSYEITLGVTYLDSAVYVDYGEDSYWSEGVGDSVHFFMANSDIGDLISLFSSDDDEASSVDWEELFGLDLTNFQIMDLLTSLNNMSLTTSASGEPAFAVPLTSLGINDSLLIRTNDDSECTGLECTNLVMGEFTISIDLSLEAVSDLKVTTPEEISEYVDLACATPLVEEIVKLVDCEYFVFEGTLTLGMSASVFGSTISQQADIDATLTMRVYDGGHFTMQIDCDIPAVSVTVMGTPIVITGYNHDVLTTVDHSHLTVYYDSEDGHTYYHHIDYSTECEETADTYEEWGMLTGHEFGSSPFQYILGNMIGCGDMIQGALGGSGEDGSFVFEWGIPSSLNGLISGLTVTEVVDETEQEKVADRLELDLALGSIFGGDASILSEAVIAATIYDDHSADSLYVAVPITGTILGFVSYVFDIIIDLTLTDSSETVGEGGTVNGTNPFADFEAYIAAHTCTCTECKCEEGECDEGCECCSEEGCECYFFEDVTFSKSSVTNTEPDDENP